MATETSQTWESNILAYDAKANMWTGEIAYEENTNSFYCNGNYDCAIFCNHYTYVRGENA